LGWLNIQRGKRVDDNLALICIATGVLGIWKKIKRQ
jgi:hypothetical protein